MTGNWLRRAFVLATCASALLLAACGSSTTESAISPTRFVTFGDGFSDVGQNGSRYTVNDGSAVNNWTLQLASSYDRSIAPASAGGTGYARGNARVLARPVAAGNAATLTVADQIGAFLAVDRFAASDVVLINGGISDIIVQTAALRAGTQSRADTVANARQAGRDLAAQVRRLTDSGANYVLVSGTYDLGKTPWAGFTNQKDVLSEASGAFNEGLLVSTADLGGKVLYIDAAFYVNVLVASFGSYNFDSADGVACNSIDPGPGIGIGNNEVNSSRCNPGTLGVANYTRTLFADNVYLGPEAHRLLGIYAQDRLRSRF